jgi:hypothetical protein
MKPLSNLIQHIVKPTIRKNGFITAQIIFDWPLIVGDYLAKYTTPLKVAFPANKSTDGVLHIDVIGAQAMIIQQLEQDIIGKISTYFGYKAVSRLKLIHSNRLPVDDYQPEIKFTAEEISNLDKLTAEVEDADLKEMLNRIGKRILEKKHDEEARKPKK